MLSKTIYFLFLFSLFRSSITHAQEEEMLFLANPSFEDKAQAEFSPRAWYDCGFEGEYVNILHAGKSASGIQQKAAVGKTYIGLVVRDNYTWEGIAQDLGEDGMKVGTCYEFHLRLSKSKNFFSKDRFGEQQNYKSPAKIKIWGGNIACERAELLAETAAITHSDWRDYIFVLQAQSKTMTHLRIEAYQLEDSLNAYNGNVLIDHASFLVKIACEEKDNVVAGDKSYLPDNWYQMSMSFDERLFLAKEAWKKQLVPESYSENSDPYKHKMSVQLDRNDGLDDAIRKLTTSTKVPVDLSKDGFIITLTSKSLKDKKYTYGLLQIALEEMKIPWEQYRIYSEIEGSKKYGTTSGEQHELFLSFSEKDKLERIILKIETKMETKQAKSKEDTFVLNITISKGNKKAIHKKVKKALTVLEIEPYQYKIKYKNR